jgi:hypothetical protein
MDVKYPVIIGQAVFKHIPDVKIEFMNRICFVPDIAE